MSHVVNGDRWIEARLAHLKQLLDTPLTEEQRESVEAELAVLTKERGITVGGHRMPRWLRRRRT